MADDNADLLAIRTLEVSKLFRNWMTQRWIVQEMFGRLDKQHPDYGMRSSNTDSILFYHVISHVVAHNTVLHTQI